MYGTLLLLVVYGCVTVQSADWGYEGAHGPSHWVDDYPACGANSQSPIDIKLSELTVDTSLTPIMFKDYDVAAATFTLKNTGHSVQVDISGSGMEISGGKLSAVFKLAQFHVHWGSTNTQGSEHTVGSKSYPMEVHFVHYNEKYATLSEAADKSDGLAVIGIFFEIGNSDSATVGSLVDALPNIQFKDGMHSLTPFKIDDFIPATRDKYYRYAGSLTTPGCFESVAWTVLESTIPITQAHMDAFRSGLYEGADATSAELVNNFRPVQQLNGRTVYYSTDTSSAIDVTAKMASLLLPVVVLVLKNIV